jgi:hypothetical protein
MAAERRLRCRPSDRSGCHLDHRQTIAVAVAFARGLDQRMQPRSAKLWAKACGSGARFFFLAVRAYLPRLLPLSRTSSAQIRDPAVTCSAMDSHRPHWPEDRASGLVHTEKRSAALDGAWISPPSLLPNLPPPFIHQSPVFVANRYEMACRALSRRVSQRYLRLGNAFIIISAVVRRSKPSRSAVLRLWRVCRSVDQSR